MVDISLTNTCTCDSTNKVQQTKEKVPEQDTKQNTEPKKVGHSYSEVKKRNSFFNKKY